MITFGNKPHRVFVGRHNSGQMAPSRPIGKMAMDDGSDTKRFPPPAQSLFCDKAILNFIENGSRRSFVQNSEHIFGKVQILDGVHDFGEGR